MVKQDWMVIVAGEALVNALTEETLRRCRRSDRGNNSEDLCALQREQAARGLLGVEVIYFPGPEGGCSVRYDSGLQNFGLLASGRRGELPGGNTLEAGEAWAREWVTKDPERRIAWRRKTKEELAR